MKNNIKTYKPEHKMAQDQAADLYCSLGLVATISEPSAGAEDPNFKGAKPWPHIAYRVEFRNTSGKRFATPYKLGVGYVKWNVSEAGFPECVARFIRAVKKNPYGFDPVDFYSYAAAAAHLALKQKVKPEPFEVLAMCCADSYDARENSFEDWADSLGFDEDSRKAEAMHRKSADQWHALTALIGAKAVERFAHLSGQF